MGNTNPTKPHLKTGGELILIRICGNEISIKVEIHILAFCITIYGLNVFFEIIPVCNL